MERLIAIFNDLSANPVFGGMLAAGIVGFAAYQLRAIPARIWAAFRSQFVVELTVFESDDVFPLLNLWLSRHPSCKKARRLRVSAFWNHERDENEYSLAPGEGLLLIKEAGRRFLFMRDISEPSEGIGRRRETIRIATLGRSSRCLVDMLKQVRASARETDTVPVKMWNGRSYALAGRRLRRGLDTLYLDDGIKSNVVADMEQFRAAKNWYAQRGIPWRRGYLLEGPPGTGKTSLIFALSCHFNATVHVINMATVKNDNELHEAFSDAGSDFIALEDIDAAGISEDRKRKSEKDETGVTMSGLLNVIDGLASHEGRVLFMTTNHPEKLDGALIRPGRVDRRFRLDMADHLVAQKMVAAILSDIEPERRNAVMDEIADELPMSQAALQNRLMREAA